jgi:hypothetical protein
MSAAPSATGSMSNTVANPGPAGTPDEATRLSPNTVRISGLTPAGQLPQRPMFWYEERIADLERRLAAAEAERDAARGQAALLQRILAPLVADPWRWLDFEAQGGGPCGDVERRCLFCEHGANHHSGACPIDPEEPEDCDALDAALRADGTG